MRPRTIIAVVIGIIISALIAWFVFNQNLNTKDVKEFIQAQLPENIELEYETINTNILMGNFTLKNASVFVKDKGIKVEVAEFRLEGLDYDRLLNTDTIAISACDIKDAFVWVDGSQVDSTIGPPKTERKNLVFMLDKFNVDFSGLEIKDANGNVQARMNGTHLGLNDLMVQSKPKTLKNQLEYAVVKIKTDSLELPLNTMQKLSIGELELDSTSFKLKDTKVVLQDKGIELNFDVLDLKGKDFNHILQKDTLVFDECILTKGNIKINNAKRQTKSTKDSLEAAQKVILVNSFKISDTNFEFLDKKGEPQLKFENTNATFADLKILTAPQPDDNSITYKFIKLDAKNLDFPMNLHTMSVEDIKVTDTHAELLRFNIKSNYNRADFQKQISVEQDVLDLSVPEIHIDNYSFSFDEIDRFFACSAIRIDRPDFTIYRDKLQPDSQIRKALYSESLRDLNFRLAIEQVKINDAKITYEERVAAKSAPGKIFFTDLDANIQNVNNKNPQKDLTQISVDANFMGHAPTHVDWRFNILNPPDKFNMSGTVNYLKANSLDGFLVPNLKARMDGIVQKTSFNFTGNDNALNGHMNMTYDNLNVELLNDKREKKGFWSAIANFLVKDHKEADDAANNLVSVERDKTKGFFNLFWLGIKEGIKQNVMKFQGRKDKVKDE